MSISNHSVARLTGQDERVLYCQFWRRKLQGKPDICFPESLCLPIAQLLDDFSFAYMQEAFVATLLILARGSEPESNAAPEQYKFYRIMKEEADMLREDMGKDASPIVQEGQWRGDHSSERVGDLENLQIRVGNADSAVRTLRRYFSVRQ